MSTKSGVLSSDHPKQLITASGKVLDESNSEKPALSSHKQAIQAQHAEDSAAANTHETSSPSPIPPVIPDRSSTPPPSSTSASLAGENDSDGAEEEDLEEGQTGRFVLILSPLIIIVANSWKLQHVLNLVPDSDDDVIDMDVSTSTKAAPMGM